MAQADSLIISVSGIRGIIGRGLTPELAASFAVALGTATQGGRIVLSRDGRPSGVMLRHAIVAGLVSVGCEVQDLGVVPTPTCGLAVRRLKAAGAIQITASHNPAEWNGLKLFGNDGRVLSPGEGQRLQQLFTQQAFRRAAWNQLGKVADCPGAESWHRDRVLELVDASRIRQRKPRVFLDANGGAGGPLGKKLLEALGCEVIGQGCDADGVFQHEPEPTAANLTTICPLVARHQATIGFVLDPDSDRLALIDETGHYIGEELTLALAARFRLEQEKGPVVVNMSTSRVIEDIARQQGCDCVRSAVGEANVADRMHAVGAVFGGEGNGGVIDPRVGYVRDPFIGMGLILNLMAATGKKLSELVAELPAYTIVKDKYTIERAGLPKLFAALQKRWPEAKANTVDGLRLDWENRWVHVRPSNTEPIVRVIAEAPDAATAEGLCREVGTLLK
jgi:phosphomannomutase